MVNQITNGMVIMLKNKKSNYFRTTKGSVILILVVFCFFQCVLHIDFWNWGNPKIYFGWITSEYLYRLILITIVNPLMWTLIQKISWPIPEQ